MNLHEPTTDDEVPAGEWDDREEDRMTRKSSSSVETGLDVDRLRTSQYNALLDLVNKQINGVIGKAIFLQRRQAFIEKMIILESVLYLISNSVSTLVGTTESSARVEIMYFFFSLGIIFACLGLAIKWLKSKQEREIESYRTILCDMIELYDQDAWLTIERERMMLPSHVLAYGFFRGINKKNN